jgi:hypothetical protein
MTRLKVGVKIDARAYSAIEKAAIREGSKVIRDTVPMEIVANQMERKLNDYERSLMAMRSSDPITGGINTAKWSVKFNIHMSRGDYLYGKFQIVNTQPPYVYSYRGYNKEFSVGRGSRKKSFGVKPWVASGVIGNLAAVRYATPESSYVVSYVMPKNGKSIMFYSHKHNAIIFRRYRQYSSGGHERYRVHIDNIIMDSIDYLPSEIQRYAPKSISLYKTKK